MKLGKFTGKFSGKLPFKKQSEVTQAETAAGLEISNLSDSSEGQTVEEVVSPEIPAENNAPEAATPAEQAPQAQEPVQENKDAVKAGDLMSELLKEISTEENSPTHLLAKSLDDVDINELLTESRSVATKLRRKVGRK